MGKPCNMSENLEKERSLFVAPQVDDSDDQGRGSVYMLGCVLICSLVGWVVIILVTFFAREPSVQLILVSAMAGVIAGVAILIGLRIFFARGA